jgi:transposase
MGYVSGQSRGQGALFPVVLDDLMPEDHPVRVIEAFVAELDLAQLGFAKAEPAATGRPPYDPGDLLRLYLYGYLNQVRSSRRLERECARNVEVMWLLNRLAPDHKTIAEFRRLNAVSFKAVCRAFVRFCAEAELIGGQWVAIDGSKFQAVASKRVVVTAAKLDAQLKSLDSQVQGYLQALDTADEAEASAAALASKQAVRAALARLQERRADVASTRAILQELKATQHVVGESEAKLMKTGQGPSAVAYNVQTAVDAKHKLIVHHELTNESNDSRSLLPMATAAKAVLGSERLNVVADAGYSNGQQAQACEAAGISAYVPVQRATNNQGDGIYFDRSAFSYDGRSESYRCPAGQTLTRKGSTAHGLLLYTTQACTGCAVKGKCTGAKQRWVSRHPAEEALERMRQRLAQCPQAMAIRRETVEHPFANLKCRILGNGRLLLRGMQGAGGEMALAVLAHNFRRALNVLGACVMRQRLTIRPA